MKPNHPIPRLPLLAVALLLATPPISSADDLLDAVLWDGPPAASLTTTAPSAPTVPAARKSASPAPSPSKPPSPPPPSVKPPAAARPAPSSPVPISGKAQIRREIQEMRARAKRLEAALGPDFTDKAGSENPVSSSIHIPSFSLSARGGAGPDEAYVGTIELAIPIGDTPFDLSVRGFLLGKEGTRMETFYASWLGRTESYAHHVEEEHFGGTGELLWRPFRESHFSPFAGIGGRYEHTKIDREKREGRASLSGRVGAVLTVPGFDRLTLKGEFLVGADSNELVGEVGLRLWSHFGITGFVESFDFDIGRGTAYGGGGTLFF